MKKAKTTLHQFLKAWKSGNQHRMYKHSQVTWKSTNTARNIEERYNTFSIEDYSIGESKQISEAAFEFNVQVKLQGQWQAEAPVNVICEKVPYIPDKNGVWGVNPISMLKTVKPK